MYRPTLRMDDVFRDYVDDLFHATDLDRNQIMRMFFMCAPYSAIFRQKIERYVKRGESIPVEPWKAHHDFLWEGSEASEEERNLYTSGAASV